MAELDNILKKYVNPETEAVESLRAAAFIVKDKHGKTLYSNALGKLNFEDSSPPFTTDSVCWMASMTKLLTSICAMQLVEKGMIGLDDNVGEVVPRLSNMDFLKGFDENGKPIMGKQSKPMTLRHLLTHTSGFGYDGLDPGLVKWAAAVGRTMTTLEACSLEGFTLPLLFEPGDGWAYGVGIDWVGHVVEVLTNQSLEAYMQEHILKPLSMSSTTFRPNRRPDLTKQRAAVGFRTMPRGTLSQGTMPLPQEPKIESGGAGLYSTANDYAKLLTALLHDGDGVLKPETLRELCNPQLADNKHLMENFNGDFHPFLAPDYPMGLQANYGLGGAINMEDISGKRPKGCLMWSGAPNTHWWLDLKTGIAGTLFTQVWPPGDAVVIDMWDELERAVYKGLVSQESSRM